MEDNPAGTFQERKENRFRITAATISRGAAVEAGEEAATAKIAPPMETGQTLDRKVGRMETRLTSSEIPNRSWIIISQTREGAEEIEAVAEEVVVGVAGEGTAAEIPIGVVAVTTRGNLRISMLVLAKVTCCTSIMWGTLPKTHLCLDPRLLPPLSDRRACHLLLSLRT